MQWRWLVTVALGLTGCRTVYVVDAAALYHARKKIRTGEEVEPMIRAVTPGGRRTSVKASMA